MADVQKNSAFQNSTGIKKPSLISVISNTALKTFGWILTLLFLALLIMISAQETFKDILIPLGLYHDRTGALIDCSKPSNRKSRYCGGDDSSGNYEFRKDPRSGAGFNLFD